MTCPGIEPYEFHAPRRIVFGWGRLDMLGSETARLGSRAFLVIGSRRLAAEGTVARACHSFAESGVSLVELATISHEPEVADVDRAAAEIRAHRPRAGDVVVGLGGGSAIDLAKAAAALATNADGQSVQDYLEGVGRGLTLVAEPLPVIAVPTTAGTGSEATKNAVISCYDPPFKKSLRADAMMPRTVIVDPQLTVTLPREITAHTGMDAVTQLIESFLSRKARPISDALALTGLPLALGAIVEACEHGESRTAREAMAHAALLSGMALANSGLGMAHGVAAGLGSQQRAAHGLACAVMLPVALRTNREVARDRMAQLARAAGIDASLDADTACQRFIELVERLNAQLGIPDRLSRLGVVAADVPALVQLSRGNSMDGNPRKLADDELRQLLEERL